MVRLTGDRYIPNFREVRGLAVVWFTGALAANLLITGTLVFHLVRSRRVCAMSGYLTSGYQAEAAEDRDQEYRYHH